MANNGNHFKTPPRRRAGAADPARSRDPQPAAAGPWRAARRPSSTACWPPGAAAAVDARLAEQLGVRRNAVVAAYEQLLSDGLAEARHGAGTYVARAGCRRRQRRAGRGARRPRPRRAGRSRWASRWSTRVLLKRLAGASRRRIALRFADELGYGDPRGSLHLRSEVARYLAANRGVRCDPELHRDRQRHPARACGSASRRC